MYHFIEGKYCGICKGCAVLDTNGVGYSIFISERTIGELLNTALGDPLRLYTYLNVREDAMELFGFLTEQEKEAFLLLTSVSGVGARGAMAVLSALTVERLSFAVLSDDAKAISAANGIGLKTAQKIILELKDKFAKNPDFAESAGAAFAPSKDGGALSGAVGEAISALVVLGYPRPQVEKAALRIPTENLSVEEIIRALLKQFGGQ